MTPSTIYMYYLESQICSKRSDASDRHPKLLISDLAPAATYYLKRTIATIFLEPRIKATPNQNTLN